MQTPDSGAGAPRPGPPVALVTGASRGLGLAVSRELADRSHRLAVCARDVPTLARAADELRGRGAEVLECPADLTEPGAADRVAARVRERFGRIDWLVNNAGLIQVGPMEAMAEEDYRAAMELMFFAPLALTRAVLPVMRAQRSGRIVTVTSLGGRVAAPHLLPYVCAKFAAVGFSQGLGAELAGSGVSATTVLPGLMRTGSDRHAAFTGREPAEYAWFAAAAGLPGVSLGARRAARAVVRAGLLRRRTAVLGLPAQVAVRAAGIAPATVQWLTEAAARLLPAADAGAARRAPVEGHEAAARLSAPARRTLHAVAGLNARAGTDLNQTPAR